MDNSILEGKIPDEAEVHSWIIHPPSSFSRECSAQKRGTTVSKCSNMHVHFLECAVVVLILHDQRVKINCQTSIDLICH